MDTNDGPDRAHLNAILSAIDSVLDGYERPLALHEPSFQGNEWRYVKECLDTGWVSSGGKFVDRMEDALVEFTGARHAVATVNGTAALHICLKLVGVQSGDEVLIPTLTFIATANAVSYCGAIPHFVDAEEVAVGIDVAKLAEYLALTCELRGRECFNRRTGARISALLVMHTFGHPVDLDRLLELCRRFNLVLVEDAAESLGSFYKGRHTGNFGRVAALSFNGNKVVTTGGGGAILTNDPVLGKEAKHLTTTARLPHQWSFIHDQIGYNYRLPNINAALGCAQLEQLPGFLERKRRVAARYVAAFSSVRGVRVLQQPGHSHSNYWLNALILDRGREAQRDVLLETFNGQGILARPLWTLMHRLPMYQNCPRMDLCCAEDLERRVINVPSSPALG